MNLSASGAELIERIVKRSAWLCCAGPCLILVVREWWLNQRQFGD
jgi:hypothetical protein